MKVRKELQNHSVSPNAGEAYQAALRKHVHVLSSNDTHALFLTETLDLFHISPSVADAIRALQTGSTVALHRDESFLGEIDVLLNLAEEAEKKRLSPRPAQIHSVRKLALNINQVCNLRCTYCYADGDGTYGSAARNISKSHALDALKGFFNQSQDQILKIKIFGGEPLLSWRECAALMAAATDLASKKNAEVSFELNTNGTLLNETILSAFQGYSIEWVVSLDGTEENHDAVRKDAAGKGTHAKVVRALELLKTHGQLHQTRLQCVVHGKTQQIRPQWMFLKRFRPAQFNFSFVDTTLDGFVLNDTQSILSEIKSETEHELRSESQGLSYTWLKAVFQQLTHKQPLRRACEAGRKVVAVDSFGTYLPCHRFSGLNEFSLGTTTEGFPSEEKRNAFMADHLAVQKECGTCWARTICGGGCLVTNFRNTGDMRVPSEELFCTQERTRIAMALELFIAKIEPQFSAMDLRKQNLSKGATHGKAN